MAGLLAVAALFAPNGRAEAAEGSVSISLADAPASPTDPRAAFYVVDHVAPGTTLERTVRVHNGSAQPATVELYTGGSSVAGGRLQFHLRAGDTAELARWALVTPSTLTIGPGADADAVVRFAVPDDATEGERLGVIWAQPPATGSGTSIVNRVGVRVYLSIGRGAAPETDFHIDAVSAGRDASGAPIVNASVRNTGGRAIEPTGTVALAGGTGVSAPIAPGLALLPDERGRTDARFTADVGDGPVHVTVVLTANGVERRVDATLTFPRGAGAIAAPVVFREGGGSSSRTTAAFVAAVLAATALAGAVRTRQRRLAASS